MGQKTHPTGFRLGINKPWSSNWFANKEFPKFLEEDIRLRGYIAKRLPNAGISKVDINRTSKKLAVTIYTSRPGIVIGKGGEQVDKLKEEIKTLTGNETQVNVSEIKRPEMDAKLVGENIGQQLMKKINYRRAVKKSIQSTMRMGADGIRIRVAGRLGGAEIARCETFHEGSVPLQTLRADIDFAVTEARTTYGIIGIKVWICNGEIAT
ncbi:MAG: 30S ribosomal protein S3 [Candidatus Marinimicrobia bacterium]|mgnify:CR=1 FL=1|jgi:small subunit ribosomal protein S3|nr:30S ribosomal protein S3 [Candidatus Neomarinimicrobiota bacterium]MDP6456055.1 30S ribosomal protein S3 [Candidatus Neomarinimicrobiota bacterium]MDP6592654.1 30S ribosomal protein S3 [Candidatus Neomarinimicrobiota bacterium]MDP6836500.1 30S ribosomal protein S3 [Candidatus Neomarinimicrobiota bacterium]MDP6966452.1 30S ribosomal protein S3 [Candidatus Neomarinimicrobiota bacterium]|tara:strand:- start:13422 stop:14048 length:627 start_codon:yes stop_codon:yes gene_type:complete